MTSIIRLLFISATVAATLGACSEKIPPDARLDEGGHFHVNWPPSAKTLDEAVAEVEKAIGPGTKLPDGTVQWAGRVKADYCSRIQLKNVDGKLSADSEQLKERHPEFAACVAAAKK